MSRPSRAPAGTGRSSSEVGMSGFRCCASLLAAAGLGLLVGCHTFKIPGIGGDKGERVE